MERSDTNNQEAWDYYTLARELFRQATKPANQEAQELITRSHQPGPEHSRGPTRPWLPPTGRTGFGGEGANADESEQQALTIAQKAGSRDWIAYSPIATRN